MSSSMHRWLVVFVTLGSLCWSSGATSAQDSALQRRYDLIEQDTAQIRSLAMQEEIEVTFKSSEQFRTEFEADLATDYPAEDRARDERILKVFGLVPQDTDLSRLYVDLYSEQVAGYYDPETGEMVVIRSESSGDSLSPSQEITYAHEVVHALQDQNFSFDEALATSNQSNDDVSLATTALIEGDATVAQTEYLTARPGLMFRLTAEFATSNIPTDQLDAAPPIIRASLLFPYEQGAAFVQALRDEGGWERVNEAYANPPASTEQILHPEKYLSGETPVPVDVPDVAPLLGSDWTQIDDNAFGEFSIRVLLAGQSSSAEFADTAALGWGGDQYRVWAKGDQTALVWQSAWESPFDASEFVEALAHYDEERWSTDRQTDATGTSLTIQGNGIASVLATDGDRVTYIVAPDADTAGRLLDEVR